MISFQQRVLDQLEAIATKEGCVLVQTTGAANTGEVMAQVKNPAFGGPFKTVARAYYHFQGGHNKIQFNGEPLGPGDMSFLYEEHEDAKINEFLRKWALLIRQGKDDKRGRLS